MNQQPIALQATGLGVAAGEKLKCEIGTSESFEVPTSPEYQWLANGEPISGATSTEYTVEVAPKMGSPLASHWYSGDVGGFERFRSADFTLQLSPSGRPDMERDRLLVQAGSAPSKLTRYGLLPLGSRPPADGDVAGADG